MALPQASATKANATKPTVLDGADKDKRVRKPSAKAREAAEHAAPLQRRRRAEDSGEESEPQQAVRPKPLKKRRRVDTDEELSDNAGDPDADIETVEDDDEVQIVEPKGADEQVRHLISYEN